MKALKLEDLKAEPGKFLLRKLDRELTVRIPTLSDEAWLRHSFGSDVEKSLKSEEGMCQFIYRLLPEEEKKLFLAEEREVTDENGEIQKVKIGGWRKLMESIEGIGERYLMARALLQARGFSAPILDEIVKEELKKKEMQESALQKSAGDLSSISSPQNTDGLGTTSGPSHEERSASP